MISLLLVVILVIAAAVTPVPFFDFQKKPVYNPSRHLPLAQGTRTPEPTDGGDISSPPSSGLPITRERYLPPHKQAGAGVFTTPLSAASALVIDLASNEILYSKNIDEPRSIASITKLMTALVVLDAAPNWQKHLRITPEDVRIGPDYMQAGEAIRFTDLWHALLIGSSNTAAMALARSTGLSPDEFVARMNQKAKAMGLLQTTFAEPSGLDPQNRATARELAVVLRHAMRTDVIARTVARSSYRFVPISSSEARTVSSTDWFLTGQVKRLSEAKVLGGKTGFTEESGYCFAVQMQQRNHPIAVIVLGTADHFSRFTEADMLAAWAYRTFVWFDENGY